MYTVSENDKDAQVFVRAKQKDEQTFILRAQDLTAPKLVVLWIAENIESAPDEKLREAFERALLMRKCDHRKCAD